MSLRFMLGFLTRFRFTLLLLAHFGCAVLFAQSPHAGTWLATLRDETPTTNNVVLGTGNVVFTIENDGTFALPKPLDTSLQPLIRGTVANDGTATFTQPGVGLTTGTVSGSTFTASQFFPAGTYPAHTYRFTATKLGALLPIWSEVSDSALYPSGATLANVAFGGGVFAALQTRVGTAVDWAILRSTDGVTWTRHPLSLGITETQRIYASQLRFAGGRFLFSVYGDNLGGPTTRICSSADALSWDVQNTGLSNTPVEDFAHAFGKWWGYVRGNVLNASNTLDLRVVSSTDGVSWTAPALIGTGNYNIRNLLTGNGLLIGMTSQGNTQPYSHLITGDGITWTPVSHTLEGQRNGEDAIHGPAGFVLAGTKVRIGSNFTSWTEAVPGPDLTDDGINFYVPFLKLAQGDGAYYGLKSRAVYRSVDGNVWENTARLPAGSTATIYSFAAGAGRLVSVAGGSSLRLWTVAPAIPGLPVVRAPQIHIQPTSVAGNANSFFSLTASVDGGGLPLTYRWFRNGVEDTVQKSQTFSGQINAGTVGDYVLKVSNAMGEVTTNVAKVTGPAITLSNAPFSQAVFVGATVNLSVSHSPTSGVTRKWYRNGELIASATGTSLSFASVTEADAGSYTCVLTNGLTTVTTNPAVITVLPASAPFGTSQGTYRTVAIGANFSLSTIFTGSSPITYQWTKDGADLDGQTSATLSVNPVAADSGGVYRLRATNSLGSTLGAPHTVSVAPVVPPQMLGRDLVQAVLSTQTRVDDAARTYQKINLVRFREDTAVFLAANSSATGATNSLFQWKAGTVSALATDTQNAADGSPFAGVRFTAEPDAGVVAFVADHATSGQSALYAANTSTLARTVLVASGSAAPGGGVFSSFRQLAARGGEICFVAETTGATVNGRKLFRRDGLGNLSLLLEAGTDLPGAVGAWTDVTDAGVPSLAGGFLTIPLRDAAGTEGLFTVSIGGTVTLLHDSSQLLPGSLTSFHTAGSGDSEGSRIVSGSSRAEAVYTLAGVRESLANGNVSVSAAGNEGYLRFLGNLASYRRGPTSPQVTVLSGTLHQLGGQTVQTVTGEAHGFEAAFLATLPSATAVYVALDQTATAKPVITTQPVGRHFEVGSAVTLTAVATGGDISWKWYRGTTELVGQTLSTLILDAATADDAGTYKAIATNSFGSTETATATLTLLGAAEGVKAPTFVLQPSDQIVALGQPWRLNAGVVDPGASAARYEWFKDGASLAFGNNTPPQISYTSALASHYGTYRLVVTNGVGTATSRLITVSDGSAPPAGPLEQFLSAAGVPEGQRGGSDDPDSDGLSNLLEYALNLNPAGTDASALPEPQQTSTHLTLTYRRHRSELTYVVETTTDLANAASWTSVGVDQGTPSGDGTTTARIPLSASTQHLRIRVTQP